MAARLFQRWEPGEVGEKSVTVGLPRNRKEDDTWPWETIVVGPSNNLPTADVFEMYVDQCDDGGLLGPIHLPAVIHVPGARNLIVRPTAPVQVQTVIFATTYLADHRGFRSFAQWSKLCILNEVVPIPAGVRAVGQLDPARFIYLDRAGAPLTSALDSAHDRPALAVAVQMSVAGVVTFYY